MNSGDPTLTEPKEKSATLRRAVASARVVRQRNNAVEEATPETLDMQAFQERIESDREGLKQANHSSSSLANEQTLKNAREEANRRKKVRKTHLLKRLKRKHGFKILSLALLMAFVWLLWLSGR